MAAALCHELLLPEHRGMQDEALLESLVSFGAAGVTLQSRAFRSSGNVFVLTASLASDWPPPLGGEAGKVKF